MIKDYDDYILEKINFKNILNNNIAKSIIISLLSIYSFSEISHIINTRNIGEREKIILHSELNSIKKNNKLRLSQEGWDHIRNEEKFSAKAYDLHDGRITIGFGHSEPINDSNYKIGQKISRKKANELFIIDINYAADGVRRIFDEWRDQNINIKLSQRQYNVLISLAFNMGIDGLRKSEFIQKIKQNELDKAAKLILKTGISDNFPGLKERRLAEYKMFIS